MGSGKNLDAKLTVEGKYLRYAGGRVIVSAARIPSLPEPFDFNAKLALSRHLNELRTAGVNTVVFDSHATDSAIGIAGYAGLYAFVEIALTAAGDEFVSPREAMAIAHTVRQMRGMRSLAGYLVSVAPFGDNCAASGESSERLLDAAIARLRAADRDRLIAARFEGATPPLAADILVAPLMARSVSEIRGELSRLEESVGHRPFLVELAAVDPQMADLAAAAIALGAAGVLMPHAEPSDFATVTRRIAPPAGEMPASSGPTHDAAADRAHDRAAAADDSASASEARDSRSRRRIFAPARTAAIGIAEAISRVQQWLGRSHAAANADTALAPRMNESASEISRVAEMRRIAAARAERPRAEPAAHPMSRPIQPAAH